jgi:hypothetical protein
MKNRNEWVRQPMVDKAANEFVAEGKQLGDITAYQVAKRLGCSPNSEIHKKFYDWQRRRQEEAGPSPVDVPSSAEAEFEAALNRLTVEAKVVFSRSVRLIGGEINRTKTLIVADAQHRCEVLEAQKAEMLEYWGKTEAALSTALNKIEEMEKTAAEAQRREDRLIGRLEQRNSEWAKSLGHTLRDAKRWPANNPPEITPPERQPTVAPSRAATGGSSDARPVDAN